MHQEQEQEESQKSRQQAGGKAMSIQRIFANAPSRRFTLILLPALAFLLGAVASSAAPAMAVTPAWTALTVGQPTHFAPNDATQCETATRELCDLYQIVVQNIGNAPSTGTVTVTDKLPKGLTTLGELDGQSNLNREVTSRPGPNGERWSCILPKTVKTTLTCTLSSSSPVAAGAYAPVIRIPVTAPSEPMLKEAQKEPGKGKALLTNAVTVEGGGATKLEVSGENEISTQAPAFGIVDFGFEPLTAEGGASSEPAAHPDVIATRIGFPDIFKPEGQGLAKEAVEPVEQVKNVVVELPVGLVGDPLATSRCPLYGPKVEYEVKPSEFESICGRKYGPHGEVIEDSEVGALAFDGEKTEFDPTGRPQHISPVYNTSPEEGYPAEFTFVVEENAISLYASIVHNTLGYRVRVAAPSLTTTVGTLGTQLAFFGDAAERDGLTPHTAFLTNPADCSVQGPLKARIEADSWQQPKRWVSAETEVYPQLEDCNLLQFEPETKLEMAPSPSGEEGTTQADAPSAYNVSLKVPQRTLFEQSATPDLKGATVTLPEGVSVSPSAADGLEGCAEHGPEGIDIANDEGRHPDEAGEGEEIGPDGLAHLVAGHCPAASTLGSVEVLTPLLEKPLTGHLYLAQPGCSGEHCETAAEEGKMYGVYLEVAGSGVVVKLKGQVEVGGEGKHNGLKPGQIRTTFTENPQFPFSAVKIHLHGGPRAPLANPQSCGTFTTTSELEAWSHTEHGGGEGTPDALSSNSFGIGGCAGNPFAPTFSAGTTSPIAGAYSPFVLSFSRQDREQDLAGLSVTLPPGLLGKIAGVPLCEEAQANAGTCGPESQIGTASVLAGPGEHQLYVSGGRVYLTTGYKGGPFGLSIVVPAVAGPFNLGNVVVRASIQINRETSQVTVVSDPLPQSRDGVPFRLRTVHTEINRPGGFTFNPTNCASQQITGTISGDLPNGSPGAKAPVSSPFAATGCASLPFKPSFTASTSGSTSKANGASFVVKVSQKGGEANIHKVDLQLPLALPARLTTLQKACTEAQFNANPAGCPEGSFIGTAIANTPVLPVPLTGPAILVSHGGAAFPDVEFLLQGDGVQILLDGGTDIKKGITYSKFETVPDAPISSFETVLPEGPHSALAANGVLCGQTLTAPTTLTGQNGAVVAQNTNIAVTGCGKPSVKLVKAKVKGNAVLVTVTTTQPGAVTIGGAGLKTLKKTLSAGAHQLKVSLTKNGKNARKHHGKTKIKVGVHNANGSSSRTSTLKL
jgi:hypothetical protein